MTKPLLHVVGPDECAPALAEIAPTHITLQPAARHAFTALEGRIGQLRRVFSGASATVTAAADVDRLCADAISELQRVRRFAK